MSKRIYDREQYYRGVITDLGDDLAAMRERNVELETELKAERAIVERECEWTNDDPDYGLWAGDCGIEWSFIDDGPTENGCKYCPSCGGNLTIHPKQDQT